MTESKFVKESKIAAPTGIIINKANNTEFIPLETVENQVIENTIIYEETLEEEQEIIKMK